MCSLYSTPGSDLCYDDDDNVQIKISRKTAWNLSIEKKMRIKETFQISLAKLKITKLKQS